ncbi:SET domain-containing protein, partial [Ohtaekwangia sp.]
MALLEKQLFVKKSTIPNAGKGLFTKKFIPKGERIIEYKGVISTWKDVKDEDGRNGYIFYVKRSHVINALPRPKALARYANDANGLTKVKGLKNNCDYETEDVRAFIVSIQDIPAGSEILVDYGKDYWKVIRENIKLWAKEAKDKAKEEKAAKAKKGAKGKKSSKAARKTKGNNLHSHTAKRTASHPFK